MVKAKRIVSTWLVVGVLLVAGSLAGAQALSRDAVKTPWTGPVLEKLAEKLEMSTDELRKELSPLHNLRRLAEEMGLSLEELRKAFAEERGELQTEGEPRPGRRMMAGRPFGRGFGQQKDRIMGAPPTARFFTYQHSVPGIRVEPEPFRMVRPYAGARVWRTPHGFGLHFRIPEFEMPSFEFPELDLPRIWRAEPGQGVRVFPGMPRVEWRTEDGQLVRPRIVWEPVEENTENAEPDQGTVERIRPRAGTATDPTL